MGTVTIQLPPSPSQVRTARLVATTMARRAGMSEHVIEEIRLAVGEACARAVQLHAALLEPRPVVLELIDDGPFEIVVRDEVANAALGQATNGLPASYDAAAIGLAIVGAVVDDVDVNSGINGTQVRMRWAAGS